MCPGVGAGRVRGGGGGGGGEGREVAYAEVSLCRTSIMKLGLYD